MAIRKIVSRSIGVDVIAAEDLADNSVTAAEIQDGVIGLAKLSATGTKDATTFLRGDNSFQVVDVNDVTGDFTVDTDVLVVDSTNDRVGVNEASPSHPLHIQASAAGETTMKVESNQAGAMNVAFDVDTDRDLILQMQEAGTTRWDFLMNGSSGTNPLILRNQSGTTIQKFTQDGQVTMPSQPAFVGHRGSNFALGYTNNIIPFDVVVLNVGSHYNSSNGRFTAPVAGTYLFHVKFNVDTDNTVEAKINVNGFEHSRTYYPDFNQNQRTCENTVLLQLSQNDYVEANCYNASSNSGQILIGGGSNQIQSTFSGYLIG